MAMDKQKVSLLVMLDLSAAFDTVNIDILLRRLESSFCISGKVLKWLESYLPGRSQVVHIGSHSSKPKRLGVVFLKAQSLDPYFSVYMCLLLVIM